MTEPVFIPLETWRERPVEDMRERARAYADDLTRRRTVREFSDRPVPRAILEDCLRAAGTAPSGANRQPWHFVAISDASLKTRIREAAEEEERAFYAHRASPEWLAALEPLGTDEHKPFLEIAPWLIAIFTRSYDLRADGSRAKHYYAVESVGIATGMLITAIHHAGLVSLTHTPSPMGFLNDLLDRPFNERPFLLLVVGYPAPRARVPDIHRKDVSEISSFL